MAQPYELLHACGAGDLAQVESCITQGGNIHEVDGDGDGVLRYALGPQDLRLFLFLLDGGASPHAPSTNVWGDPGFQIIGAVAQAGWAEGVRALLDRGANANARGADGSTPLMGAAAKGSLSAVQLLIERGAWLNDLDNDGDGALFYALDKARFEVADCLVATGADVSPSPNQFGNTPLLLSATRASPFSRETAALRQGYADQLVRLARSGANPLEMYAKGFALARAATQIVPLYDFDRAVNTYDDLRVVWIDRTAGDQLDWVFSTTR